jgi:hypothetical protein
VTNPGGTRRNVEICRCAVAVFASGTGFAQDGPQVHEANLAGVGKMRLAAEIWVGNWFQLYANGMLLIRIIRPFVTGCSRKTYAAIFNFWAGVMLPMPMFGRSLL